MNEEDYALKGEFKYRRMKTIHEINMKLMHENAALKASLKELLPIAEEILYVNMHEMEFKKVKAQLENAKKLIE